MRRLPPLSALRVFEVAARTASYTDAAVELGLTHGAVSRQIATLEHWLGQRLFVRVGRRMAATPAARAFAAEVGLAFDRIVAGAEACGLPSARHVLRVSAPATFAMRWLIPRLDRYQAQRPHVEVTVTTTTTLHDELRGGFDIAVRRGSAEQGAWPTYSVTPFLSERDTVIVSSALHARAPLRDLGDLAPHALLSSATRSGDWSQWLEKAGYAPPARQSRRVFDHFFVTLQAVLDGLGVGVGPFPVLDAEVESGRLCAPFASITVPRTGYVALVPNDAGQSASMTGFVDWLVAEGDVRHQ